MTEHEDRSTDDAPAAVEPQRRPGQELAAARERAGVSFETMAEGLRLPKRQLAALEADDYASLPPPAYVRGYLRAYAREVGLDGDEILALFDAASGDLHDPDLHPAAPSGPVAGGGAGLPIGLAVIALVVVAGIGGWWWQGRPPADPGAAEDTAAADTAGGGADAAATDGRAPGAGDGDRGGAGGDGPDGGAGPRPQTPGGEDAPGERVADAADATTGESAAAPPEPEPAGGGSAQSPTEPAAGADGDPAAAGDGDGTAGADPVATVDDGLGGQDQDAAGADTADDGAQAATDTDADTAGGAAGDEDGTPAATGDAADAAGADTAGDGAAGETAAATQLAEGGQADTADAQQDAAGGQAETADGQEDDAEAEPTRERDTPAATSSAEEATTTAARVGPDELVLEVDGRTWMEVYDAGDRELVYTLYLGSDPVRMRGWAPFDVFLGNSPAVTVRFNGEEVVTSAFTRSDNTARFLVDEDGARRR